MWDGSGAGEAEMPRFVLRLSSRRALDRLVGDLPDRGFGRAYVEGSLEVEGLYAFLGHVNDLPWAGWPGSSRVSSPPRWPWAPGPTRAGSRSRRICADGCTAAPATARRSATTTTSRPSSTGSSWAGP